MSYPVTTPFGQVPGYPLNGGFHNGIDYGYPMGTPVVVNGVTIGISNNTGASTGPHLHVGKWVGGKAVDPGVGNGFSFNSAVVYDTGSDATNGNFVRVQGDGALWNYLHLEKTLVTKGQVLKGGTMAANPDGNDIATYYQAIRGDQPTKQELDFAASLDWPGWNKQMAVGIKDLRAKAENLVSDRDNNLYPTINATTEALGLPVGASKADIVAAINKLKSGTVDKNAVIAYINKNLN